MVRVNIINPRCLADQHLIAEYAEILMLAETFRRQPQRGSIPPTYRLGKGHQLFFRDKLRYLKRRHEQLKAEMRRRGFRPQRTLSLRGITGTQKNWSPRKRDFAIITKRLLWKVLQKPGFYRYYGKHHSFAFFNRLLRKW